MDLLWWHGRACHRRCRRSHRGLVVHLSENPAFMLLHINDTSRTLLDRCLHLQSSTKLEKHMWALRWRLSWIRIECRHCSFLVNRGFPWHTATVRMMLFIRDGISYWKVFGERNIKYIQGRISKKTRSMSTSSVGVVLVWSLGLTQTISIFLQLKLLFLLAHSSTLFSSWTQLSNIGGRNAQVDVIGEFKHSG